MTMRKLLACLAVLAAPVSADPGRAIAEAEVDGFKVVAAVVQDEDWREKWTTPREQTPSFNVDDEITLADRPTLLVFFAPPDLTVVPQRLNCRLAILENDEIVEQIGPTPCHEQDLQGSPNDLFLTGLVVGFTPEADDIGDDMRLDIIVEDPDRQITVPVSVAFTVVKDRAS